MKIHLKDKGAYLWGDWTAAEMSYNTVEALTGLLEEIQTSGIKKLEIDCANLKSIDDSGARYFYIWLNCLKLRGIEYELVNLTGRPDENSIAPEPAVQALYCNPFQRMYLTTQQKKRRRTDDGRRDKGYRQAEAG